MRPLQGANVNVDGVKVGIVAGADEAAAFDLLGPLARAALRDAPIKVLAAPIVADCRAAMGGRGIDPRIPEVDRRIALSLRDYMFRVISADRGAHDAELGLRPIRARASRKR